MSRSRNRTGEFQGAYVVAAMFAVFVTASVAPWVWTSPARSVPNYIAPLMLMAVLRLRDAIDLFLSPRSVGVSDSISMIVHFAPPCICAIAASVSVIVRNRFVARLSGALVALTWCPYLSLLGYTQVCVSFEPIELAMAAPLCISLCALTIVVVRKDRFMVPIKPIRCHHCNYELTGLTTERCPECGSFIPGV